MSDIPNNLNNYADDSTVCTYATSIKNLQHKLSVDLLFIKK